MKLEKLSRCQMMEGFFKFPVSVVGSNKESPLDNQSVDQQAQPSGKLVLDHQQCGLHGNKADSGCVAYQENSNGVLPLLYALIAKGKRGHSKTAHAQNSTSADVAFTQGQALCCYLKLSR